tara:strand:- start:1685 stop:2869 length:1185 start_codon:yes stop_codon:yes gene_type:complete
MVKDEGTKEIITGKNKYFLHYESYSILNDPVNKDNFVVSFYVPIKNLLYTRPGIKQVLPIHPNCNVVDINKNVYKNLLSNVKQEFGEKGTFHLKSQGIKIVCKDLEISDTTKRVAFSIDDITHQGIVDGANLYLSINKLKLEEIYKHSYVKVDFYVMQDSTLSDDMVETLDAKLSIDNQINLSNKELHWLQEVIDETDYRDEIDTTEVLCLINLFRNNYYDAEVNNQPTDSYWNKQKIKEMYKENPNSFIQYKTIVKDILYLYDYVNWKTQELWPSKRGSLTSLGLTTQYNQKAYEFNILDKKLDYKLHDAVIYILLNGFRPFVIFNSDTTARWSKDFSKLLELYDNIVLEIISIIKDYSSQMGHNPHLLGKNKMLYSIIYKEFMMGDLLNQFL